MDGDGETEGGSLRATGGETQGGMMLGKRGGRLSYREERASLTGSGGEARAGWPSRSEAEGT